MRARGHVVVAFALAALTGCSSPSGPEVQPGTLPPTAETVAPTTALVPGPGRVADPAPSAPSVPAAGSSVAVPTTSAASRPSARPLPDGDFAPFDEAIRERLVGHGALAFSVAVAKDGRLLHELAVGSVDPTSAEPVGPGSRFRIGSISKTLLAVPVVQLAREGLLDLDAPGALVPLADELGITLGDPAMAGITIRQLLSHTSGLPEYERTFFGGIVADCRAAAERGLSRGLLGPPGTLYRYSNMNYCLLGLVAETATGVGFQELVRERVLDPLGIHDMRTVGTEEYGSGEVHHPVTPGRRYMEALGPAGAWVGTAADLVRVFDALDPERPGPDLVDQSTLEEMLARPPVLFSHPDQWYGLGLRVWDTGASWGHTGTIENARSMVLHQPDGITWAVLVSGSTPRDADSLKRIVGEALATVPALTG